MLAQITAPVLAQAAPFALQESTIAQVESEAASALETDGSSSQPSTEESTSVQGESSSNTQASQVQEKDDNEEIGEEEEGTSKPEVLQLPEAEEEMHRYSNNLQQQAQADDVYQPSDDTYVFDGQPSANYGTAEELVLKETTSGYTRRTLLKFDIAQLVVTESQRATLHLYVTQSDGATYWQNKSVAVAVYATEYTGWQETQVNFTSAMADLGMPAVDTNNTDRDLEKRLEYDSTYAQLLGEFTVNTGTAAINDYGWVELDITEYLRNNPDKTELSLVLITQINNQVTVKLASKEHDSGNAAYIAVADKSAEELAYAAMRTRWANRLTGNDYADSAIRTDSAKLIEQEGQAAWEGYIGAANTERTTLWADLNLTINYPGAGKSDAALSLPFSTAYQRIRSMALAWATRGSALQGDEALKADIIDALSWMHANVYNQNYSTSRLYGNWWHWGIGIPKNLCDTVILMYDELPAAMINDVYLTLNNFNADPTYCYNVWGTKNTMTSANLMDTAQVVMLKQIIGGQGNGISQAVEALLSAMPYVTGGDGFYVDGSCVQHTNLAYTAGYGTTLLNGIEALLYLLADTPWAPQESDVAAVYEWIVNGYMPLFAYGGMMDMVKGRAIARPTTSEMATGRSVAAIIAHFAAIAPAGLQGTLQSFVKQVVTDGISFYGSEYYAPLSSRNALVLYHIYQDANIQPQGRQTFIHMYGAMDKAVVHNNNFAIGLGLYSSRIGSFEYGNGENLRGWNTSAGTVYLYMGDAAQYSADYWPTVDAHRLPGITTDHTEGTISDSSWVAHVSNRDFVGGSVLGTQYASFAMDYQQENSTLSAKKSWFVFGDAVVALGSDITSTESGKTAETIVENRKLADGTNTLVINGQAIAATGASTQTDVSWAWLQGNLASGADATGYYFIDSQTIEMLSETRTGSWADINSTIIDGEDITSDYLSLAINHGEAPSGAGYSYVLLPGYSQVQTQNYANNNQLEIIAATNSLHAVRDNAAGVTGYNFFTSGKAGFVSALTAASVTMANNGDGTYTFAVSDPSQSNDVTRIQLCDYAWQVVSADNGVTTTTENGFLVLQVPTGTSHGASFTVTVQQGEPKAAEEEIKQTLYPKADTYIFNGAGTTNYGNATALVLKETGASYTRRAFIKFDISDIQLSANDAALLRLYVSEVICGNYWQNNAVDVAVYATNYTQWAEDELTYNNVAAAFGLPAVKTANRNSCEKIEYNTDYAELLGEFTVYTGSATIQDYGWVELDITEYIRNNPGVTTLSLCLITQINDQVMISFSSKENGEELAPKLLVAHTPVSGVTISEAAVNMLAGETCQLTAAVQPQRATNKNLVWSSSNEAIATVTQEGFIEALQKGTVTISAASEEDSAYYASCTVEISDMAITPAVLSLQVGNKRYLDYRDASAAAGSEVRWTTSNANVATVAQNGLVTAVGEGDASITVTSADGNRSAVLSLQVTQNTTPEDYQTMRARWLQRLLGGDDINRQDTDIAAYIAALSDSSTALWDTMYLDSGRQYLWDDPNANLSAAMYRSAHYTRQLENLKTLALAYATEGTALYAQRDVYYAIVDGLDFITNTLNYGKSSSYTGNWWDWQIGCTQPFVDVLMILKDYLPADAVNTYVEAINTYAHTPNKQLSGNTATGANLTDIALAVLGQAVLVEDDARVQLVVAQVQPALTVSAFNTNKSENGYGDGLYPDGSFIYHTAYAYTGSYGNELIKGAGRIMNVLAGTANDFEQAELTAFYDYVLNAFLPLLYNGRMPSMVGGRSIARQRVGGVELSGGNGTMANLMVLAQNAPQEFRTTVRNAVRYHMQATISDYNYYQQARDFEALVNYKDIMADITLTPAPFIGVQVYGAMDRVVQATEYYGVALAMSSKRIYTYECGNGENLHGWHTGSGMLYIYDADTSQYGYNYWPTVDAYRLPGTTVSTAALADGAASGAKTAQRWVGGATNGEIAAVGFAYNASTLGQDITAKKSYFLLDGMVVAVGTDIQGTTAATVETTVENRMLNAQASNQILVNGAPFDGQATSQELEAGSWVYLQGNLADTSMAYLFPNGAEALMQTEHATGVYNDINTGIQDTDAIEQSYFKLGINHGTGTVTDGEYYYIIVPGATPEEAAALAGSANISLLQNNAEVQALYDNCNQALALNVWAVNGATVEGYTVDASASMVITQSGNEFTLTIAEPKHLNNLLTINLPFEITSVLEKASEIEVKNNTTLTVNTSGAGGASFQITYTANIPMEGIALDKTVTSVEEGLMLQLTASALPAGATDVPSLQWKSSNETVATVSQQGVVTALKPGQTTISVEAGSYSDSLILTVTPTTLTGIAIERLPDKTIYLVGQQLNTKGLVVTGYYSNGTTAPLTGYEISGFDSTTGGEKQIKVCIKGFEAKFIITVETAENIEYEVVRGNGEVYVQGTPMQFEIAADSTLFRQLTFNGVPVNTNWYTVETAVSSSLLGRVAQFFKGESGNLLVTLLPEFFTELAAGEHAIQVVFTNGYANLHFIVAGESDPSSPDSSSDTSGTTSGNDTSTLSPDTSIGGTTSDSGGSSTTSDAASPADTKNQTGDSSQNLLLGILAVASLACIVILVYLQKKTQSKKKH